MGLNLAVLPFLLLAFASLTGGSLGRGSDPLLLLRSNRVFRVVLRPIPCHSDQVHQAAPLAPGCCCLLTGTMWALRRFLEEESQTSESTGAQHRPLVIVSRRDEEKILSSPDHLRSGSLTEWQSQGTEGPAGAEEGVQGDSPWASVKARCQVQHRSPLLSSQSPVTT